MNNHSIAHLTHRLTQALDKNYGVVNMDELLFVVSELENTTITKEELEATRLAKYINELRRHTQQQQNDPLARRLKNLLKKWREMVIPSLIGTTATPIASSSTIQQHDKLAFFKDKHQKHNSIVLSEPNISNLAQKKQPQHNNECNNNIFKMNFCSSGGDNILSTTSGISNKFHKFNSTSANATPTTTATVSTVTTKKKSSKLAFSDLSNDLTTKYHENDNNNNNNDKKLIQDEQQQHYPVISFENLIAKQQSMNKQRSSSSNFVNNDSCSNNSRTNLSSPLMEYPSCETTTMKNGIDGRIIDLNDSNSSSIVATTSNTTPSATTFNSRINDHRKNKKHKKDKKQRKEKQAQQQQQQLLQNDIQQQAPPLPPYDLDETVTGYGISSSGSEIVNNNINNNSEIVDGNTRNSIYPILHESLSLSNSTLSIFPNATTTATTTTNDIKSYPNEQQRPDLTFTGKFNTMHDNSEKIIIDDDDDINMSHMQQSNVVLIESRSCSPFANDMIAAVTAGNDSCSSTMSLIKMNTAPAPISTITVTDQNSEKQSDLNKIVASIPVQSTEVKSNEVVQDLVKMPKKRGRKKGSKGIDAVLAATNANTFMNSQYFESSSKLLSISGNKKVKTTIELLADIQNRKSSSTTSSPTLPSMQHQLTQLYSAPPSPCSERSKSPSTMSTVERFTPDQGCGNMKDLIDDDTSDSNMTTIASSQTTPNNQQNKTRTLAAIDDSSILNGHLDNELTVTGLLLSNIEDDISSLYKQLVPIQKLQFDDSNIPCTCTVRELHEPITNIDQSTNDKIELNNTVADHKIDPIITTTEDSSSMKETKKKFVSVPPPSVTKPTKSIFDLDYDDDDDENENPVLTTSIQDNPIIIDTTDTIHQSNPTNDINFISEDSDENSENETPVNTIAASTTTIIDHDNVSPINLDDITVKICQLVTTPLLPLTIFPKYDVDEDELCPAKQRYNVQTQLITKFHINALHYENIKNVNGNWEDATTDTNMNVDAANDDTDIQNVIENITTCATTNTTTTIAEQFKSNNNCEDDFSDINELIQFYKLYERVVPEYSYLIRDHIPKQISHIQFTENYLENKLRQISTTATNIMCKNCKLLKFENKLLIDNKENIVNNNAVEVNADEDREDDNDIDDDNDEEEIEAKNCIKLKLSGLQNNAITIVHRNCHRRRRRRSSDCSLKENQMKINQKLKRQRKIDAIATEVAEKRNKLTNDSDENSGNDCDNSNNDDDDEDDDDDSINGDFHEVVTNLTNDSSSIKPHIVLTIKKTPNKLLTTTIKNSGTSSLQMAVSSSSSNQINLNNSNDSAQSTAHNSCDRKLLRQHFHQCYKDSKNLSKKLFFNYELITIDNDHSTNDDNSNCSINSLKRNDNNDHDNNNDNAVEFNGTDTNANYDNDAVDIDNEINNENDNDEICDGCTNNGQIHLNNSNEIKPDAVDEIQLSDYALLPDENNFQLISFNALMNSKITNVKEENDEKEVIEMENDDLNEPQQHHQINNNNQTDGGDEKMKIFKEWHEVLQVCSYNNELLTIMPYVTID